MKLTQDAATREAVFEALLEELQHHRMTQSEFIGHLRSNIRNDVLASELIRFDAATGPVVREFRVPLGSVAVANHSTANAVFVQGASPSGTTAPANGTGVHQVSKSCAAVINLTGHVVTFYGTPGDTISVQIFTKGQPPAYGPA